MRGLWVLAFVVGLAGLAGGAGRQVPPTPTQGRTTIVHVDGMIDLGLAPFLERVVARLGKDDVLVLDINTLGGRIDAAIVIRDALLGARARTVAWIHPRAISAGALIALACDVVAVSPGATIGAATPVSIEGGEMKPVEEKVVSYMRKEMRATAEAKGRDGLTAEAMVDADVEVPGLDIKGKLLTLDGAEALAHGVADVRAADEAELWKALGVPPPARLERPRISWAERLGRFLSDPAVSSVLMTVGMLGIFIELTAGGHGIALLVGLACLGLFFFGHLVVKLAGLEEILLFAVGAALVAFEVLVPGHILPGIIGGLCLFAALILALVNLDAVPLEVAWKEGFLTSAAATVFGSVLATVVLGFALGRVLPRTTVGRRLVLTATIPSPVKAAAALLAPLVGAEGVADTALRPSGKALFGGERIEAVAERGFIEAGSAIAGVRVEGARLIVREVQS